MSNMKSYETPYKVASRLVPLLDDAINKLEAALLFEETYPNRVALKRENDWYALAHSAILESLLLDIASFTDNAKHGKDNTNCNFKELKYVLENSGNNTQQFKSLIGEIDSFLNGYNNIVPAVLRNKILAHRDIEELFSGNTYPINYIEITRFLIEGYNITSNVYKAMIGAGIPIPDFNVIKKKYKDSMKIPLK